MQAHNMIHEYFHQHLKKLQQPNASLGWDFNNTTSHFPFQRKSQTFENTLSNIDGKGTSFDHKNQP